MTQTEPCPGLFTGKDIEIACGHPKGHPPVQDISERWWRHGRGGLHWGPMPDYLPSPVSTRETRMRELADQLERDADTGEYPGGQWAARVLMDVARRIRKELDANV